MVSSFRQMGKWPTASKKEIIRRYSTKCYKADASYLALLDVVIISLGPLTCSCTSLNGFRISVTCSRQVHYWCFLIAFCGLLKMGGVLFSADSVDPSTLKISENHLKLTQLQFFKSLKFLWTSENFATCLNKTCNENTD